MAENMVGFNHGALADKYEKQANEQGYTFGDRAKWVQDIGFGIVCAWIQGCMTDSEYDRILQKFQKKVLIPNLKKIEETTNG